MIKNNKKKRNKLFITIIECSLFLLIIYLFVSNLSVNNIFKGGKDIGILTTNEEPDDPDMARKLFRTPYIGEKRRCFIYISPKSKDGEHLVKVAAPPTTLTWGDFVTSKDLEVQKDIDDEYQWLEIKTDNPNFKEYKT